jgi:hypothetical protein
MVNNFDYEALVDAARQNIQLREQLVDVVASKKPLSKWSKAKKENHATLVRLVQQHDLLSKKESQPQFSNERNS